MNVTLDGGARARNRSDTCAWRQTWLFGNNQTRILTAFLEAGEALILSHSAAGAGRLTGRTCQCVEATERTELCPLFLLCHFSCLQKLRTRWFPTSMGL